MFSRYLTWFQSWRQQAPSHAYQRVSEEMPLLGPMHDQATSATSSRSTGRTLSESAGTPCRRLDTKAQNNNDHEQSLITGPDNATTVTKKVADARLECSVTAESRETTIDATNRGSVSTASCQWSNEAQDGNDSQRQGSPDIKSTESQKYRQLVADKAQLRHCRYREQRPSRMKETYAPNKESRGNGLAVVHLVPPPRLDSKDIQIMEDKRMKQTRSSQADQWSTTATAGGRTQSPEDSDTTQRTTTTKRKDGDTQVESSPRDADQERSRKVWKARGKLKDAIPDISKLSTHDREMIVAKAAAYHNNTQNARDGKYERFQEKYTQPWILARETRAKAADETIRAAKAEAAQKASKDVEISKNEITARNSGSMATESMVHRSDAVASRPLPGSEVAEKLVERSVPKAGESTATATVRFGVADASNAGAQYQRPLKEASKPWPHLDARDKAILSAARANRAQEAREPKPKTKTPDAEETTIEPDPVEEPRKRHWKASDPSLDPDSLLVRYAQLKATTVPELDRYESRRLFELKQEQLKKERVYKWWEDEDRWCGELED